MLNIGLGQANDRRHPHNDYIQPKQHFHNPRDLALQISAQPGTYKNADNEQIITSTASVFRANANERLAGGGES